MHNSSDGLGAYSDGVSMNELGQALFERTLRMISDEQAGHAQVSICVQLVGRQHCQVGRIIRYQYLDLGHLGRSRAFQRRIYRTALFSGRRPVLGQCRAGYRRLSGLGGSPR